MKICVVVTARPSWAKLQTLCEALRANPDVELQIIACASALLERYGRVVDVIRQQGFTVAEEVYSVVEGENLRTSVHGTGLLCSALGAVVSRHHPDIGVVMADRHEVLAAAQAFSYLHVPFLHCQGGESSGSVDNRVRDAVTALADYHATCTEMAKFRVISLTGAYDRVFNTGCSSIDIAKRAQLEPPVTISELGGSGAYLFGLEKFGVVLQHPVTSEADQSRAQMIQTLNAVCQFDTTRYDMQWILFWPGEDAGAAGISKAIREYGGGHTVRNLPPNRFLRLLTQCSVLVGNSSAGIREASYLGVPVVNVGTRQHGRERAKNVIDVPHDAERIAKAIEQQIAHGPYESSALYGTGNAGQQIAEVLTNVCVSARSST